MVTADTTIHVTEGSELDRLLDQAQGRSIVLIRDGDRYRLVREDRSSEFSREPASDADLWRERLRSASGLITKEEAERWIAVIRHARDEGSRAIDSP